MQTTMRRLLRTLYRRMLRNSVNRPPLVVTVRGAVRWEDTDLPRRNNGGNGQ